MVNNLHDERREREQELAFSVMIRKKQTKKLASLVKSTSVSFRYY